MGYERDNIRAMEGYVPGKQPSSGTAIKLNTNENPYPPSPAVFEALAAIEPVALRRYPPPTAEPFRLRAAAVHGVSPAGVIAVNGSDELLRLAVTTFVEPGRPIGVLEPSYSFYPALAAIHGSPLVRHDLQADWSWPTDGASLGRELNAAGVTLTMIVNPHAPSGRLSPLSDVLALGRALDGVLLLDEAYVDFIDPALGYDSVALLSELDNLLITRTFSKGYGLAGLRFGYGLGNEALIAPMLWKTRDIYNVDAIAQRLAVAALEDRAYAAETWRKVRAERARMTQELGARGFAFAPDPSQANFLLARVPEGNSAAELQRGLEQAEILVRHFDSGRLRDQLRISIGTPEENARLLAALDALL